MAIELKTPRDLEAMRVVGKMAAETLSVVGERLRVGMTTDEIDAIVRADTLPRGATCSTLGYHGFTKSCCTSINDVVCHGIPGARVLAPGDIINVDITSFYGGFHGDTSATFFVGPVSAEARHITEVARHCLALGIAQVREDARIGDIGAAIQEYAEAQGCSVVRDIVGHGIGRKFHTAPDVPHVGRKGNGIRMKAGMVFTIEPMVNLGGHEYRELDDGWTIVTKDGSLSAQFEHTLVVTKTGCEILTPRDRPLVNSEIFGAAALLSPG
jgi:methionyl aminopeptidase